MASGVHAVALRLKQAKKKKMMQDHYAQQQLGSKPPPPRETLHGSLRVGDPPIRSPRRTHHPSGWDAASDTSYHDRPSGIEYRQRADKAHKKWLKKQQHDYESLDFRKSYIAADESSKRVDLLLWFGLAVLVTGTVVSFVGLGEKGFKTQHLRFLGPVMCAAGLALVSVRIFVCCCAKRVNKAASAFTVKNQLAKMVQVQQVVAAHSIREAKNIPAIHVDPSCESGLKTEATGLTELSPCFPESPTSETDFLVTPQWTTAVIETETEPSRSVHFEDTLSPVTPGSCSSTSPLRPNEM